MKTGKSLTELAAEIERRAGAKKDYVASTKNILMDDTAALKVGDELQFDANTIAHDQIAAFADIPKKYYDRMLATEPALLAANVNKWFQKEPTPRMVRTLDGKARAFLSDRYRPLENEDLAEAVLPVLLNLGLDIMSSEITDRRLYIKAVDPKLTRELKKINGGAFYGDMGHTIARINFAAITISNSEVGQGALSVLGGVYDGGCSNLSTFGERSVKKYHVGGKHEIAGEELYALLSDDTRRKTDAATWAQIADVVKAAFDRAKFDELCNKIEGSQNDRLEGDVVKAVNLASKRLGLNEGEGQSVLKSLIASGDLNRFGLFNAITRTAQDVENYDRATELEAIGANVITLPRSEWKVLAEAA